MGDRITYLFSPLFIIFVYCILYFESAPCKLLVLKYKLVISNWRQIIPFVIIIEIGWLILFCTLAIIVFTVVSIKLIFVDEKFIVEKVKEYLNMVVRAGILAAAMGFTGTIYGGYLAIAEIREAAEISMYIVWGGVNVALSSTILGFEIFIISALIWFVLRMRVIMRI